MYRCPDGGRTPARERFAFTPTESPAARAENRTGRDLTGEKLPLSWPSFRQIPASPVSRSDLSVNSHISLANLSALRIAYRIEMLIMFFHSRIPWV